MDSLICNPNDVYIAYDYIKQVYKDCDDNNLEPIWVDMLDKFLKKLNELSHTKYFKSMFMQDLMNMQCKSQISQSIFDEYFASKSRYVYNELALDIVRCLGSSDRLSTRQDKLVYAFDKSPRYIASWLLFSEQEHTSRILLELFVDRANINKWKDYDVSQDTLSKIKNVRYLVRNMDYFLSCVNASFKSIKPDKYRQEFEASTREIIDNKEFVGMGSEEGYKKAIMSGFSKIAYHANHQKPVKNNAEPQYISDMLKYEIEQCQREREQWLQKREEEQRLQQEQKRLKEELERQKREASNFRTSEQHYAMMLNEIATLTQILVEKAKIKRSVDKVEGCYLFNELDFLLIKSHSAHTLISLLNSRIDNLYKELFNKGLTKTQLLKTLEFLKSANKASKPNAIKTQIQFLVDGKPIPPTDEQVAYVQEYLKQHKIALNEVTYTYALRRLIIGGDINSRFDKGDLLNFEENACEEDEIITV
ncbi:MAG: hypothetical protein IJ371_04525 [Clostridia bacterium]|nr:hypothetical protein [Clostridia bacterium]